METNPTRNHEVGGSIPGLTQWVKDLVLLWRWCSPAATALIRPLAWESPYAAGAAVKRQKTKKKRKKEKEKYDCGNKTFIRWSGNGTRTLKKGLAVS